MQQQLTSEAWRVISRHKRLALVLLCASLYLSFACVKSAKPAGTAVTADNPQLTRSNELIEASRNDDIAHIQQLLSAGADPNYADVQGFTPLMIASLRGTDKIVQALLEAHANVNTTGKEGFTALRMAIQRRHPSTVSILLRNGADVTLIYRGKRTALHDAVETGDSSVVSMLLDKGAEANARDAHGETPLLLGIRRDQGIVTELIAKGADVNAANADGWTPLMEAAGGTNLNLVKVLIENGADAKATDKDGWTAHKQALLSGCDGIVAAIARAAGS